MLLSLLLLTCSLQFQDKFIDEDGNTTALQQNSILAVDDVGVFVIYADFLSPLMDYNTNLFSPPRLQACYSLRPIFATQTDFVRDEHQWIFGGPSTGQSMSIVAFNEQTGLGTAEMQLPVGVFSNTETSGQFWVGEHELIVYWGLPYQVFHDGFHPPATPMGSKVLRFQVEIPEVFLTLPENRGLLASQESSLLLGVREKSLEDRTFLLGATPAELIEFLPTSVVLPANETVVIIPFTPLQEGECDFFATSSNFPGQTFESQHGVIHRPSIPYSSTAAASVGPGDPLDPYSWDEGASRSCISPLASNPNKSPGNNVSPQYRYGECKKPPEGPQPSDCSHVSLNQRGTFYSPAYCEWTWWPWHWCRMTGPAAGTKELKLTVWKFTEYTVGPCGSTGASREWNSPNFKGGTNQEWIWSRAICKWELTKESNVISAKNCR